jgi:hypothetical protein
MRKFNIKSIILGIGIGIVMTTFISIIYLAGSNPRVSLTNEEIIRAAKQLGMIKGQDSIKAEDSTKGQNIKQKQNNVSSYTSGKVTQ